LTIDNTGQTRRICEELSEFSEVSMEPERRSFDQAGEHPLHSRWWRLAYQCVARSHIRMISQGASFINLSVVDREKDLRDAVELLHTGILLRAGPEVLNEDRHCRLRKNGRMIERPGGRSREFGGGEDSTSTTTRTSKAITAENFRDIDVAIDFSTPSSVIGNIERIAALGVNLRHRHKPRQRTDTARSEDGRAAWHWSVWSPKLFRGRERVFPDRPCAAKLLSNEPEFEAWAWEIHHSARKTRLSGSS